MRIRSKVGRLGAVIAAGLLAISGLTALPSSSQPAVAQQGCTPSEPNVIQFWINVSEFEDRGVTLCRGDLAEGPPPETPAALVQIVDFAAGAKLRLISEPVDPQSPPAEDSVYRKREAFEWFSYIQSNVPIPAPGRLFSTTNASFFTNTSDSETPLSLPELTRFKFPGSPVIDPVATFGLAFFDNSDPAWVGLKRGLRVGANLETTQNVELFDFPTNYDIADIADAFDLGATEGPACGIGVSCLDATVAFHPSYDSGEDSARRTYVGIDATNKVYVLAATVGLTFSEAQDILGSFGSVAEVQLDGGGSTQTFDISTGGFRSVIQRPVPDVLAVYLSPE